MLRSGEVERPAGMPRQPLAHLWDLLLDRIGEADEPLVAMVQHVAADDGAIEDVESWEQRGGAVTFRIHTSSSRGLGFIGNPGRVRSSAWIWLFSSTERTTGTPRTSENYTRPGAIRAGNVTGLGERGCAAAAVLKQSLQYWAGIALAIYSPCFGQANFKHAIEGIQMVPVPSTWFYHGPRLAMQPAIMWRSLFSTGVVDWPWRRST
jgi:hypothetical protein